MSPPKDGRDPLLPWPLARREQELLPRLVAHAAHTPELWIHSREPQPVGEQLTSSEHVSKTVHLKSNVLQEQSAMGACIIVSLKEGLSLCL